MIWGLMINDLNIQLMWLIAINDMRPSFPIDTQRIGMGLKYNADSYGYLLMMASLLKDTTEQDLFKYNVDDRSLHNGADFVIKGIMDPLKQIKSIRVHGGDRWGSIEKPSKSFIKSSTYLMVYVNKFQIIQMFKKI